LKNGDGAGDRGSGEGVLSISAKSAIEHSPFRRGHGYAIDPDRWLPGSAFGALRQGAGDFFQDGVDKSSRFLVLVHTGPLYRRAEITVLLILQRKASP
jgi:hypothetical protein